jgi:hypothetical protein
MHSFGGIFVEILETRACLMTLKNPYLGTIVLKLELWSYKIWQHRNPALIQHYRTLPRLEFNNCTEIQMLEIIFRTQTPILSSYSFLRGGEVWDRVSLCSPGWPRTWDPLASVSPVLPCCAHLPSLSMCFHRNNPVMANASESDTCWKPHGCWQGTHDWHLHPKLQVHTPLGWPWVLTARLQVESLEFCNCYICHVLTNSAAILEISI